MILQASMKHFKQLNEEINSCADNVIEIEDIRGQRYIGAGLAGKQLLLKGVPGNALGAYLDGAEITVYSNVQDAAGDTMNQGKIIVHGSCGDAAGYAMRGGLMLVRDNIGYRAGIHMKQHQEKIPALVAGGEAGSFLGEYQAGGYIVILGLNTKDKPPVGRFCSVGMHGGKMFLRTESLPYDLPAQVLGKKATKEDMAEIMPYLEAYCQAFVYPLQRVIDHPFYVLTPNTKNPYKRLYTIN